jgi:hypothetical protein
MELGMLTLLQTEAGNYMEIKMKNFEQKIDKLIEEAKTKHDLKKIHKQIVKKDKLDVGFAHGDVGEDNSFFMPKSAHKENLEALENPGFIRRWLESKHKGLQKDRQKQLKLLKQSKPGEDGLVVVGNGPEFGKRPEVLAHELGHASNHKETPALMALRHPLYTMPGKIGTGMLAAMGHPISALGLFAATQGPTLYDEGRASWRGYQNLEDLKHKPQVKPLLKGFSTYALGASLPFIYGEIQNLEHGGVVHHVGNFLDKLP